MTKICIFVVQSFPSSAKYSGPVGKFSWTVHCLTLTLTNQELVVTSALTCIFFFENNRPGSCWEVCQLPYCYLFSRDLIFAIFKKIAKLKTRENLFLAFFIVFFYVSNVFFGQSVKIMRFGAFSKWFALSRTPLIRTPRGQAKLSVLTGVRTKRGLRKKSPRHMFSRRKERGKRFYGNKTLFNCTVTVTV